MGGSHSRDGGPLQGWGLPQDQRHPSHGPLPHQALPARVQEPGAVGRDQAGPGPVCWPFLGAVCFHHEPYPAALTEQTGFAGEWVLL